MALSVLSLFLASSLNLAAASDSGRISGKILDPQGVAVAGADLKLIDSAGSLVRETTSDPQGNFTLDGIHGDEYQLRGESGAFVPVIVDISLAAGEQKEINLPFHLQVRGEFEFVRAKPLGDGFVGASVTEVRGAILRPLFEKRMSMGANFLIAHGYTGQTTEYGFSGYGTNEYGSPRPAFTGPLVKIAMIVLRLLFKNTTLETTIVQPIQIIQNDFGYQIFIYRNDRPRGDDPLGSMTMHNLGGQFSGTINQFWAMSFPQQSFYCTGDRLPTIIGPLLRDDRAAAI